MKGFNFDFSKFFRSALLVILLSGLFVAIWHIAWLHKTAGVRYEIQVSDRTIHVLDRHASVVHSGSTLGNQHPIQWRTSPLP